MQAAFLDQLHQGFACGKRLQSPPPLLGRDGRVRVGEMALHGDFASPERSAFCPTRSVAAPTTCAFQHLLLTQPGEGRVAFEQDSVPGHGVMDLQKQRISQRRRLAPRGAEGNEAVRVVGVHGGTAKDEIAFATQGIVDPVCATTRSTSRLLSAWRPLIASVQAAASSRRGRRSSSSRGSTLLKHCGVYRFIPKPCEPEFVLDVVEQASRASVGAGGPNPATNKREPFASPRE